MEGGLTAPLFYGGIMPKCTGTRKDGKFCGMWAMKGKTTCLNCTKKAAKKGVNPQGEISTVKHFRTEIMTKRSFEGGYRGDRQYRQKRASFA